MPLALASWACKEGISDKLDLRYSLNIDLDRPPTFPANINRLIWLWPTHSLSSHVLTPPVLSSKHGSNSGAERIARYIMRKPVLWVNRDGRKKCFVPTTLDVNISYYTDQTTWSLNPSRSLLAQLWFTRARLIALPQVESSNLFIWAETN